MHIENEGWRRKWKKNEKVVRGRSNIISDFLKPWAICYNTRIMHSEQECVSIMKLVTLGRNSRVGILKNQFFNQVVPKPGEFTIICLGISYVGGFSKCFDFLVINFVNESTFPRGRCFRRAHKRWTGKSLGFSF